MIAVTPADTRVTSFASGSEPEDDDLVVLDFEVVEQLRSLGRDVGDDGFVFDLIGHFIVDSEARLLNIRAAVDSSRPEALSRPTHALKGAAAQLGGCRLVAACLRVEAAIEIEPPHDASSACRAVERAYATFRAALVEQAER